MFAQRAAVDLLWRASTTDAQHSAARCANNIAVITIIISRWSSPAGGGGQAMNAADVNATTTLVICMLYIYSVYVWRRK